MSSQEKLFVVVDPTDDKHIALERAILTSEIRDPRPLVHVFVAAHPVVSDTLAINHDAFRDETYVCQPLVV